MAKRKHELLTDAERELLIGIPSDRDHLARLYTLEPADIRGGSVHLHSPARLLSGAAAGFMPLREAVG